MKLFSDRKKIIQVLFPAAVVLLIAFIIINKTISESSPPQKQISAAAINSIFKKSLKNLGYEDKWIDPVKKNRKYPDSLKFNYSVLVPADLPIPVVIDEINLNTNPEEAKIISNEKRINGEAELKIYSGGFLKLNAMLKYDNTIRRKAGYVGLLIDGWNNLSLKEDSIYLSVPESFAALIIPSKNSEKLISTIKENHKEYAILLNDDITDLDYKLNPSYSKKRLRLSIISIARTFSDAIFFLIDKKSDLYKSSNYSYVKNEFAKRKIRLVYLNSIPSINGNDVKTLNDNFHSFVSNIGDGEKKLVLVSSSDFLHLKQEIVSFRKIGYKFINPSQIIVN